MIRKKKNIRDLHFFIRNGAIDCKDYFIPLNAISYVRLTTQRNTTILTLEISTGHTFLLRHPNIEFLSDLMHIIKTNRFNTTAYYEVDVQKGTIFCTNPGNLNPATSESESDSEANAAPDTAASVDVAATSNPPYVPVSAPATPAHSEDSSGLRTAAAAFRSKIKRPASVPSKKIHMAEARTARPDTPPTLPKAGSGVGISNGNSIGCGFTAAEIYAKQHKETTTAYESVTDSNATAFDHINTDTEESAPDTPNQNVSTLLPNNTPAMEQNTTVRKAPPVAPNVQPPKRKKNMPKYYSASEYLRNHGELSTTSNGPIAPYQEILSNQRKNDSDSSSKPSESMTIVSPASDFSGKEWTDVEYYFFQRKSAFDQEDVCYEICEKLEDLSYHKNLNGMLRYLRAIQTDTLQTLFADEAYRELPLLRRLLSTRLSIRNT